jgi:hypothetical protein
MNLRALIHHSWPYIVVGCLLIYSGVKRNTVRYQPNPLATAIHNRDAGKVHELLEAGINANERLSIQDSTIQVITPVRYACRMYINANSSYAPYDPSESNKRLESIIRDLVKHGARLSQVSTNRLRKYTDPNRDQGSELTSAVTGNSIALYKLLIELGADPKIPCGESPTLLFCSPGDTGFRNERNTYELLSELVKAGVEINKQDDLGRTALHYAAAFYFPDHVKALVKLGANVNIKDDLGLSALDCAKGKEAYNILVAAGAKHGNKF